MGELNHTLFLDLRSRVRISAHRLQQCGRRVRPRGVRGGEAAALAAVLLRRQRVDAGEERTDAAELAGEARPELPRLGGGHVRQPECDVPRGGRLRLRRRRDGPRRRRRAAGDRVHWGGRAGAPRGRGGRRPPGISQQADWVAGKISEQADEVAGEISEHADAAAEASEHPS